MLINLTLRNPRFLTGALICAHLQPHGLYHAVGAWSPLLSASDRLRELRFRRRLHLPAIIVLQRLHHMCGLPGAAAEHESTATPSRSTPLPKHVGEPYLLGLPLPEIWRHGVSVLRATFDQRDSFVFLTGSGRIVWLLPGSRPPFARTMESFVREDTPSYLIVLYLLWASLLHKGGLAIPDFVAESSKTHRIQSRPDGQPQCVCPTCSGHGLWDLVASRSYSSHDSPHML